jgi:ATP-dependent DNA ligase
LATLVDRVPRDKRWIHDIKFDGYRLQRYSLNAVERRKSTVRKHASSLSSR